MINFLQSLGIDTSGYNGLKLDFSIPHWTWAALFALAACLTIFFSIRGTRLLDLRRRRVLLWVFRAAALLMILLVLINPAMVLEQREPIRPRAVVLWDTSRSMGLKTDSGAESRIEKLNRFWKNASDLRARLSRDYAVDVIGFDSGARPLPKSALENGLEGAPEGESTDIMGGLKVAAQSEGGAPLAAVMLFSDGADNSGLGDLAAKPEELKALLGKYPAPVFTVGTGGENLKDIGIADLSVPDYGFIRNAIDLNLTLRARGFDTTDVPVTLLEGDRVITTKSVSVGRQAETYPVTLSFSPDRVGTFLYTVRIPTFTGESVVENNERQFSLQVLRDKIRVLYVVGSPSWDVRFLREALVKDPTIELISFYILREQQSAPMATDDELSLIQFPTDELFNTKIRTFDLIIFQNFSWKFFLYPQYLQNIRDFVLDFGGGLMMIGGKRSFASGGYAVTPVADILPVEMTMEAGNFAEGEYKPRLTDAGARHPITALRGSAEESKALWDSLPPVEGFNPSGAAKSGATVLLDHPFQTASSANMPVMAVSQEGRGRVLALMTDTSWRWNFLRAESGGGPDDYLRLWRAAVRWLVGDPEGKQVRVRTDRVHYSAKDTVRIRVKALGKDYAPEPEPKISLKLSGATGMRDLGNLRLEGEEWALDLDNPGPGGWRLEASADSKTGEILGADETVFVVEGRGIEYEKPWPNSALLEQISKITGGKAWDIKHSPDAGSLPSPKAWRVAGRKRLPLWDNWLAGTLILLLLSMEWYFRRRWGLN